MAESAQALQRRAGLLQRLNCQMVGDDARSMERVTTVRAVLRALECMTAAQQMLARGRKGPRRLDLMRGVYLGFWTQQHRLPCLH